VAPQLSVACHILTRCRVTASNSGSALPCQAIWFSYAALARHGLEISPPASEAVGLALWLA